MLQGCGYVVRTDHFEETRLFIVDDTYRIADMSAWSPA
jgi:hypothetical protein